MTDYSWLLKNLTERNCNARIRRLEILMDDDISRRIAIRYNAGISSIDDIKAEYNQMQNIMEELCSYKRKHECLRYNDPGYMDN